MERFRTLLKPVLTSIDKYVEKFCSISNFYSGWSRYNLSDIDAVISVSETSLMADYQV